MSEEQKARCDKVNCPNAPAFKPLSANCPRCFHGNGPCICAPATDEEKRAAGLMPTPAPPAAERVSAEQFHAYNRGGWNTSAAERVSAEGWREVLREALERDQVIARDWGEEGTSIDGAIEGALDAYAAQERTIAELRAKNSELHRAGTIKWQPR